MSSRAPALLRPQLVNGKWRGARISARKAANIRKQAIIGGKYMYGANLDKGEWDPAWDKTNKAVVPREPKGKIHERNKPARVKKIEEAMATMDERMEELRKNRSGKRAGTFVERVLIDQGFIKEAGAKLSNKEKKKANKMQ